MRLHLKFCCKSLRECSELRHVCRWVIAEEMMKDRRKDLPIWPFRQKILETVEQSSICIIIGETGSGKTTQIAQVRTWSLGVLQLPERASPRQRWLHLYNVGLHFNNVAQMLDEAGYTNEGRVGVTQPRRVVRAQLAVLCTSRTPCNFSIGQLVLCLHITGQAWAGWLIR